MMWRDVQGKMTGFTGWQFLLPSLKLRAKALEGSSEPTPAFPLQFVSFREGTPLKTNMSTENERLEDVFPTDIVPF